MKVLANSSSSNQYYMGLGFKQLGNIAAMTSNYAFILKKANVGLSINVKDH